MIGERDDTAIHKIAASIAVFFLYVGLHEISGLIVANRGYAGTASILFLPAFVRLFGMLVAGLWSIPALFAAAYVCVDYLQSPDKQAILSLFLATGAPLAILIASHLLKLKPSLQNLTPLHLLWLSLASGLGNSIFYNFGLHMIGMQSGPLVSHLVTFVGDVAGTWTVIYAIKLTMHFWWPRKRV